MLRTLKKSSISRMSSPNILIDRMLLLMSVKTGERSNNKWPRIRRESTSNLWKLLKDQMFKFKLSVLLTSPRSVKGQTFWTSPWSDPRFCRERQPTCSALQKNASSLAHEACMKSKLIKPWSCAANLSKSSISRMSSPISFWQVECSQSPINVVNTNLIWF